MESEEKLDTPPDQYDKTWKQKNEMAVEEDYQKELRVRHFMP